MYRIVVFLSILLMANPAAAQTPDAKGSPEAKKNVVQSDQRPIQVFILAGQSNMQGQGAVSHFDHLIEDEKTRPEFSHLKENDKWTERDDVWVYCIGRDKKGKLSVGFGRDDEKIGPELGFGYVIGNELKSQVLIIKTSWGGRSLKKDYLPPSSGGPGNAYSELVAGVDDVLSSLKTHFPEYDEKVGYELAGFVWFQGWNDKVDRSQREKNYELYKNNLANLIKDLRKDLAADELPFVIGELGVGGPDKRGDFQAAQAAVAKMEEFRGTVGFARTSQLYDMDAHKLYEDDVWKGPEKEIFYRVGNDRPYHYLGSGKIYYRMGHAFGLQMLELIK